MLTLLKTLLFLSLFSWLDHCLCQLPRIVFHLTNFTNASLSFLVLHGCQLPCSWFGAKLVKPQNQPIEIEYAVSVQVCLVCDLNQKTGCAMMTCPWQCTPAPVCRWPDVPAHTQHSLLQHLSLAVPSNCGTIASCSHSAAATRGAMKGLTACKFKLVSSSRPCMNKRKDVCCSAHH